MWLPSSFPEKNNLEYFDFTFYSSAVIFLQSDENIQAYKHLE